MQARREAQLGAEGLCFNESGCIPTTSISGRGLEQPRLAPAGQHTSGALVANAPTTIAVQAVGLNLHGGEPLALHRLDRVSPQLRNHRVVRSHHAPPLSPAVNTTARALSAPGEQRFAGAEAPRRPSDAAWPHQRSRARVSGVRLPRPVPHRCPPSPVGVTPVLHDSKGSSRPSSHGQALGFEGRPRGSGVSATVRSGRVSCCRRHGCAGSCHCARREG